MKKLLFLLLVVCLIGTACEKESKDKHALISSNLSKKGSNDTKLLIGEWKLIKFAYTKNGENISDVKTISMVSAISLSYNTIEIRDDDPKQYISNAPSGLFGPWMVANENLFYSISGYLISYSSSSDNVFLIDIHVTDEGYDVLNALMNTYSFVIKDNELIVYFTGDKNKNLLILKKT